MQAALAADPEAVWPQQVVTAVRALFEAVLSDPLIARAVIVEAPTVGPGRHRALPAGDEQPGTAASWRPRVQPGERRATCDAGGHPRRWRPWSAYQRLIAGEVDRIETLLPEAIEFLLRPYLGEAEAVKWAKLSQEQSPATVSTPTADRSIPR